MARLGADGAPAAAPDRGQPPRRGHWAAGRGAGPLTATRGTSRTFRAAHGDLALPGSSSAASVRSCPPRCRCQGCSRYGRIPRMMLLEGAMGGPRAGVRASRAVIRFMAAAPALVAALGLAASPADAGKV